jgi:hypothetical protein
MRLFVALDLPWPLRDRLGGLATGIFGARWVPRENLHLTLRFIGEVPNWRAEEVDLALHAIRGRSFPLVLAGVGLFEKAGRVTALWAGVDRCPALDHLQAKIETALQRAEQSVPRGTLCGRTIHPVQLAIGERGLRLHGRKRLFPWLKRGAVNDREGVSAACATGVTLSRRLHAY